MTRDTASSSALARLAPAVVVAVVVTASHIGSLANGLTLDARALVLGNPALREATWANVRTILTSDYWSPMATNGLYRPVTTLSFLANWALLGNAGRPLGYHVVNLLLHLCCALAALALFRRLGLATAAAVVATLLFAVHPVTTEVVANVAGRADLLAALGVLCGLLCQARARAARGGARMAWETGLVAAAVLGMFAKENAVVLLPLLIVWEALSPSAAEWRARARGPALAAGVAAVMLAARWWVRAQGYPPESSPLDNPILEAGLWEGRATALGVLAQQAGTLVWPAVLRADY
ncbi:MAG TPA: hypothetical protein VNO26_12695, partial [Candidatus Limnocylindria bacterium]|nr:hypothetical protein [Candidatus Limnocylindria bacterium]